MTTKIRIEDLPEFDPAEYITTPEDQLDLIEDAFETGDRAYILNAIGIVARARGIGALQQQTGLSRATFYSALSEGGNPTFGTMMAVLKALGLKMAVHPVKPEAKRAA